MEWNLKELVQIWSTRGERSIVHSPRMKNRFSNYGRATVRNSKLQISVDILLEEGQFFVENTLSSCAVYS